MSRVYLGLLLLLLCSCNDDNRLDQSDEDNIWIHDTCGNVNLVACSFEFREGKWVEVQDSLSAIYFIADTIWFKEDSLIGWSNDDDSYSFYLGYFNQNLLYKQPWNSTFSDPVSSTGIYTSYTDSSNSFKIHWNFGRSIIDYIKIE